MVKVICFLRMTGIPSICGESPLTYSTERGEKNFPYSIIIDQFRQIQGYFRHVLNLQGETQYNLKSRKERKTWQIKIILIAISKKMQEKQQLYWQRKQLVSSIQSVNLFWNLLLFQNYYLGIHIFGFILALTYLCRRLSCKNKNALYIDINLYGNYGL